MSKRISRETIPAIGILVLLVIVTIGAAIAQGRREAQEPPLSSSSTAPGGAKALWLWLDALGYPVSSRVGRTFAPPDDAAVTLILEPTVAITGEEWRTLDAWVDAGGTLVLSGAGWPAADAFSQFFKEQNSILRQRCQRLQ